MNPLYMASPEVKPHEPGAFRTVTPTAETVEFAFVRFTMLPVEYQGCEYVFQKSLVVSPTAAFPTFSGTAPPKSTLIRLLIETDSGGTDEETAICMPLM